MTDLFTKISIKNIHFKNRIVMPPMHIGWADNNGNISDDHIDYYKKRAEGGCGLIILEAHSVTKNGRLGPNQLGIWDDRHIEGLKKIADVCHKYDTKVIVQINHSGLKTPKAVSNTAYAPSDIKYNDANVRVLTVDQIAEIKNSYLEAAKRAKAAGLDGVEVHGAHGYLIGQFMSPIINKRTDKYGGDIKNRVRFAIEIIEMIKSEVADKQFLIGYRIGGNEPALEDGIKIAKLVEDSGIDILHVSSGMDGGSIPIILDDFNYNWIVYCGTEIKKNVKVPVIVVNGIRTPNQAKYLIENNMADFIAIGRGQIADPEWANKANNNDKIIPYIDIPLFSLY
jgi:NADPH2 dehydrogenase